MGSALVAVLQATACASSPAPDLTALIDYSASVRASIPNFARELSDTILPALPLPARLTVFPIDGAAAQRPKRIAEVELTSERFERDSDGYMHAEDRRDARERQFIDSIRPRFHQLVLDGRLEREAFASSTDILGALSHLDEVGVHGIKKLGRIGRVWAALEGSDNLEVARVVLLFSDGIQEGEGLDFSHGRAPSPLRAHVIVDSLRKLGRLPDLHGVDVLFTGATADSPIQAERVHGFWLDLIMASGGRLAAYDFDASSTMAAYLRDRFGNHP